MSKANQSTNTNHEGHWEIVANGAKTYEVQTAGKYVDRNIDFIVPAGSFEFTKPTLSVSAQGLTASAEKQHILLKQKNLNGELMELLVG